MMLISHLCENETSGGWRDGRGEGGAPHEYDTANELFQLMAKNHPFDRVENTLAASDLVILYKNIEVGNLISEAEERQLKKPNQYVETIVYCDESEGSDSDGERDWRGLVAANHERIELFNPPSLQNTLTQKFGNIEIHNSYVTAHQNQFFFKDPYVKEQLKNFNTANLNTNEREKNIFPASLLDYICCKRLEDDHSFYMDDVIRYVTYTIDQLKRISNGDYLSAKAKEKWREVEQEVSGEAEGRKALVASASSPLRAARRPSRRAWDDVIHSEVDVRTLSKILEKKIILEVPRQIRDSYKLFSELCSNNLIVSCTREPKRAEKSRNLDESREPRLDVVLQISQSEPGKVMSTISSIMVVKTNPQLDGGPATSLLSLPYTQDPNTEDENAVKIFEIKEDKNDIQENFSETMSIETHESSTGLDQYNDFNDVADSKTDSLFESGDSGIPSSNILDIIDSRATPDVLFEDAHYVSQEDLTLSIHNLNMSSVPEEECEETSICPLTKKKSNAKVRVKSPYENKSHLIEERKRRKLIEIRERREKRKMAMNENSKINKYKYGKSSVMPQPSSSVTKLSITNKSFYNSIYGHNVNMLERQIKYKTRKGKKENVTADSVENETEDVHKIVLSPAEKHEKFDNRSYYLDDAVTEIMYTQQSDCSSDVRDLFSASTSMVSNDMDVSFMVTKLMSNESTQMKLNGECDKIDKFEENYMFDENKVEHHVQLSCSRSELGTAIGKELDKDQKKSLALECRRSIDKLYNLMRTYTPPLEYKPSLSKLSTNEPDKADANLGQEHSTIPCSDSGTSLKHHPVSSNPSSFSFEKIHVTEDLLEAKDVARNIANNLGTVVPKVIISSKQNAKFESEKNKKDRKKVTMNTPFKVGDNPLKAISQLLHEFDNVQKTKQRSDPKSHKKLEVSFDNRNMGRPSSCKKRNKFEYSMKDEHQSEKNVKFFIPRDRKSRPNPTMEPVRGPHMQISHDEKNINRVTRKKIADIIDEVKEAKGEAVRGPSRFNARLNSLAQPKKSYVQAHSEEYQNKYGRNLMADRLQRLASAAVPLPEKPGARGKPRRGGADAASGAPARPPLEKGLKYRRSASSSPVGPALRDAPYKPYHVSDVSETKHKLVSVVESNLKHPAAPAALALQARAPLVPHDLDLASMTSTPNGEESTAIGSKLHRMIDSMINAEPRALVALSAGSRHSTHHYDDQEFALTEDALSDHHPSSLESDLRADIFEDKHVKTAVEKFPRLEKPEDSLTDFTSEKFHENNEKKSQSNTELKKLEDALHRQMSVGSFQKRLRMKNLTLTPKKSTQHVFLLQSGDGSVYVKSTESKSLELGSFSDNTSNIRSLPTLTNPQLHWNIPKIPMQITTVGYAFPTYNTAHMNAKVIQSLHNILNASSTRDTNMDDNSNVCLQPSLAVSKLMQDIQISAVSSDKAEKVNLLCKKASHVGVTVPAEINKNNEDISKTINSVDGPKVESNSEDIDCTSSLDVLVGLLNEIQKITACHISTTGNCTDIRKCEKMLLNHNREEKHATCQTRSIASLEKLSQLETRGSIYSMYISNKTSEMQIPKVLKNLYSKDPYFADKEVNVDFPEREFMSTATDAPSKLFPIRISHSTNVTNSLLGILSKPSNTISSIEDFETFYSDSSFECQEKIKEISQEDLNIAEALVPKADIVMPTRNSYTTALKMYDEHKISIIPTGSNSFRKKSLILASNHCLKSSDFDPIIKMKRDILVTVYSMLVLTVFAALSFQDMLYYT